MNLSVDLMLRGSDLLNVKVSESGTIKNEGEAEENWKEYSLNASFQKLN